MWDLFQAIDFEEYNELLFSARAPILPQMVAFNLLVFIYLVVRKYLGLAPLSKSSRGTLKVLYIAINILLLFQRELGINEYLLRITPGFLTSFGN